MIVLDTHVVSELLRPAPATQVEAWLAVAIGPNRAFMDARQPVRTETKMAVVHLNQQQLAARWCVSEATLERWRCEGLGPRFLKLCGRVLYRQVDIDVYEESCLATSSLTQGGFRSKVS